VTGKDNVLWVRTVSPGTRSTVALTVWGPFGGDESSVTWAVACWPGVVWGTTASPLIDVSLTS
jgi:hypothetical protein